MELFKYTYQGETFESRAQHFFENGHHWYRIKLRGDFWLVIEPSDIPEDDGFTWVQSNERGEEIQKQELIQAIGKGLESVGLNKIIISSMGFKEYLDYCVTNYYSKVIEKYDFRLSKTYAKGLGALYTYQNEYFNLQIVNDKGIVCGFVASLNDPERFVDIDILFALIRISESDENLLGESDRKMIVSKTLSCEEQASVVDKYYISFVELLAENKYEETFALLEKLFKERFYATIES
jgi:hypothetical protein